MYKNQLQELAQRSCFNLPCYTCIREGPDHAPRFKATVSFNGEVFESEEYHSTLRQAEHAAAEVALSTLSQRGPTQSLAARILDETGVCKNLLQETAQRTGFSLPVYTTIRSGPKHLPLFKCVVEIGGRHFKGEPAKTKKQAEKNAATAAWSALNSSTAAGHMPLIMDRQDKSENGMMVNAVAYQSKGERSSHQQPSLQGQLAPRSRVPIIVRDRSRSSREHNTGVGQTLPGPPSSALMDVPSLDRNAGGYLFNQQPVNLLLESNHEIGQRFVSGKQPFCNKHSRLLPDMGLDCAPLGHRGRGSYQSPGSYGVSSRRQGRRHQRRHSLSGMESPVLSQDAMVASRASAGGNMLGRALLHHQQQQIRGLPYQSLSERFDLKRPSLLEELQLRDEDDDWFLGESTSSLSHLPHHSMSSTLAHKPGDSRWHLPLQSQSERFDVKTHHLPQLEEGHFRDEEDWLCDEPQSSSRHGREQSLGISYGCREGCLQGEASPFTDSKNPNYTEGWLRGEFLKRSLENERRHGFREGWLHNGVSKQVLERDIKPMSRQQSYVHQEGLDTGGKLSETDGSYARGLLYGNDAQNEKSAYGAAASPSATSFVLPLSSLWSKSTQWWGSHMPGSTSSATASVASTFGLRPPRSAAPAVKVRQMVPVCSAPPPRHPDNPARRLHLQNEASYVDKEQEARQVLGKLRL